MNIAGLALGAARHLGVAVRDLARVTGDRQCARLHPANGVAHGQQHGMQRLGQTPCRLRRRRGQIDPSFDRSQISHDRFQFRRLQRRTPQYRRQHDQDAGFDDDISGVNEHGRQLGPGKAHDPVLCLLEIVKAEVLRGDGRCREGDGAPIAVHQQKCQIHKNPEVQLGQALSLMNIERGEAHDRNADDAAGHQRPGGERMQQTRQRRCWQTKQQGQHPGITERRQEEGQQL